MKVLVTGGAGYFGGALSRALIEQGHSVRILDLRESKYVPLSAEFVKGDIRDFENVEASTKEIDLVYHLAFVQTPSDLPEELQIQVNINGTRNLLRALVNQKLKRLVFVSTIEVYGSRSIIPITEETPLKPVGIYSMHKIVCEKLCLEYYHTYGLPCTIARLPVICGEGYYNHKLLLAVLDRVIDSKLIFIPSPGNVLADMIHIKDAIAAMTLLIEKDDAVGKVFHFSAKQPATHLQMAKMAIEVSNSKSKIIFIPKFLVRLLGWLLWAVRVYPFPSDQIDYLLNDFVCDNSKSKSLLGYNPNYTVLDAIKELVQGYNRDRNFIWERKIGDGLI